EHRFHARPRAVAQVPAMPSSAPGASVSLDRKSRKPATANGSVTLPTGIGLAAIVAGGAGGVLLAVSVDDASRLANADPTIIDARVLAAQGDLSQKLGLGLLGISAVMLGFATYL